MKALASIVLAIAVPATAAAQPPPIPRPDLEAVAAAPRQRAEAIRARYDALAQAAAPDPELAGAAGSVGQIYFALGLHEAARAAFGTASFLAPSDFRWLYYQALVSQVLGRSEQAVKFFEQARRQRPDDLATLIRLGDLYLLVNRTTEAQVAFSEVLRLDSANAAARFGLGRVAAESGDHTTAVREFETALEIQPEAEAVHYPLGQAYRRLGDLELAREHLAQRGDAPFDYPDPLADQVAFLVLGSAFEALQTLAEADDFSEANFLGFALSQLGAAGAGAARELEAILDDRARQAVGLDSTSEEAARERLVRGRMHYALGGLLIDQQLEEEGIAEFRTALSLAPELQDARIKLGNAQVRAGLIEEGIAEYTRVLESGPDNGIALMKRGAALMALARDQEAVSDLQRASALDPSSTEAHLRLALALRRAGDSAQARRLYASALSRDLDLNELAGVHLELGNLDREAGDAQAALEHYEASLAANPDFAPARLEYATTLGRLGRYAESAASYRELINGEPQNEKARIGEVTALLLLAREADAARALEEGVVAIPQSLALTQAYARLLAAARDRSLRDGERAMELASQALSAVASLENAETLAMAMAQAGRFDDAVSLQKRILEEAQERGQAAVVERLQRNLALYEARTSCCGN